ncbi:MAG: HEAT repeat domain-containing protein [Anaerolineae bacterium]|nr:HEAT repeat domain-containing protein [Anaerolineae bacterium]
MPTVDALIVGLHSPDPDARLAAASGLGQYGALNRDVVALPDAVPHLIELLAGDPTREVRLNATYALGAIGQPEAVPALIDVLHQSGNDLVMQLVIVKALGKIGDPMATEILLEMSRKSTSRCICVAAAKTLERIGTPQALAAARQIRSERSVEC